MPPRLSLTMIVKDEAATLPACLASVRDLADEIIVVDTGSIDATPDIARQHGARFLVIFAETMAVGTQEIGSVIPSLKRASAPHLGHIDD